MKVESYRTTVKMIIISYSILNLNYRASKDLLNESDAVDILQSAEKSKDDEGDDKTLSQFLMECEKEEKLQDQLLNNSKGA
jgi:hypothetical protein